MTKKLKKYKNVVLYFDLLWKIGTYFRAGTNLIVANKRKILDSHGMLSREDLLRAGNFAYMFINKSN